MSKKITVYSTPTCVYCTTAKNYFKEKGWDYEEINVANNPQAAQAMVEKTGQMGVPVIEIGDQFIVGFDKEKIDKAREE